MSEKRFLRIISNFVIVVVVVIVSAIAFFEFDGEEVPTSAPISGIDEDNTVSFMFNMTNNGEYLLQIADILQENDVCATFFFNGKWMVNNMNLLEILEKKGNEIGNQGFLNRNYFSLTVNEIKGEILTAKNVIKKIGKDETKIFSPQGGVISENVLKACDELNYKVVTWSLDSRNSTEKETSDMVTYITENLSSGDIVRFFIDENTYKALPEIIEFCQTQNFKIKKLSECI